MSLGGSFEYSIGLRGEANLAAIKGSAVHGVMELLALAKLARQNNKKTFIHDSFSLLPDEYGLPIGTEFDTDIILNDISVEDLLNISYSYYDRESPGIFDDKSYDECLDLVNKALVLHKGAFDPRNCEIYAAELPFEIVLQDDWAQYEYESPQGVVTGQLALKGTIDLVMQVDDNMLECLDYKTSKTNNDWATGKLKVEDRVPKDSSRETSLYNDTQLMLYYYVLAHTFPDKDIMMTLYFIRLDKPMTILFDRKTDLPRIHNWLREKFEYIKSVERPAFIDGTKDGWKCRFCPFSTRKQHGSNLSICRYYQKEFQTKSLNEIMLANSDYSTIASYGAGGSSKNRE